MKQSAAFVVRASIGGLLIVVPVYLAVLLLLKAMQTVAGLARPLAMLLPAWLPAERALSLMLVLIICFLVGAAVRTPTGQAMRERIERSFFERLPGYAPRGPTANARRVCGAGITSTRPCSSAW